MTWPKAALLVSYLASVVLANWLIRNVGPVVIPGGTHLVPVGFGLLAPSGALAAALTLGLRDVVQRTMGRRWGFAVILPGAAISAVLDVRLGLASGAAFLLGELEDTWVFTGLQRKGLGLAVGASVAAGAVVDSFVFLYLAGIPFSALPGLLVAKAYVAVGAWVLVSLGRRWLPARPSAAWVGVEAPSYAKKPAP